MIEQTIKRAENRAKAIDLLGGECVKCGNEGTSGLVRDCLEFDHINKDREGNNHCLSQMWSNAWDTILKELKKCQLLCHSCHVQKSIIDNDKHTPLHGELSMYTNNKCRCSECRETNTVYMRQFRQKMRIA